MVGQLRLKPHINDWEDDDEEVTFYANDAHRPRQLRNLAAASSSESSSSSSSTSDLSAGADGLDTSNRTNERLDTLRVRSARVVHDSAESGEVKINTLLRMLGKFHTNVCVSATILIGVSIVSILLGVLSIKVIKPEPQWDKSLDAFQIPNHPSTINREMFDLAKKDHSDPTRARRSIGAFPEDFESDGYVLEDLRDGETQGLDLPDDTINPIISSKDNMQAQLMNNHNQLLYHSEQFTNKESSLTNSKMLLSKNENHINRNYNLPDIERRVLWRGKHKKSAKSRLQKRSATSYFRSKSWRMQIVYMARGDDQNIFTLERLKTIHEIEMNITRHPDFAKFCAKNAMSRDDPALGRIGHCLPPNSLMTYFYPSQVNSKVYYDGMGTELADINGTLSMAMNQATFYWFVDTSMNSINRRSKFMRAEVWFGTPVGDGSMRRQDEYGAFKKFIFSYTKLLDKASTDKVDVLYGGTEIFDHEVSETISHDTLLSIPTFLAIFLLLLLFTSLSAWLTLCGLLSIVYSFCCAYFCYRVFFRVEALGLLNVVSVFVIIGIGVDDVFVFVNTFRQADSIKDPVVRMGHTISTAGTATFFTSITTAGAFGANMASQIPAIYDFGLFMMLLVVFCWLLVVTIMPPALNIWHRYLNCELQMMQKCRTKSSSSPARSSSSLYRVLAQYETQPPVPVPPTVTPATGMTEVPPHHVLDDSDIPLLDLDEEPQEQGLLTDDEDDVPLIEANPSAAPPIDEKEAASLTTGLQKLLHKFVAIPVMKGRWAVIVLFGIVFCVTVVLVTRLTPASRPPALYRPDTNLQRLLDLAYNFSGQDINCRDCSGFEKSQGHSVSPPFAPVVPSGSKGHGPLTPRPELPTHAPETTFWPVPSGSVKPSDGGGVTDPAAGDSTSPSSNGSGGQGSPTSTTQQIACNGIELRCQFGSVCDDSKWGPRCKCKIECDQSEYDPVCGSDQKTYASECQMKQYACMDKRDVSVLNKGFCDEPPTEPQDGDGASSGASISPSSPGKGYNPCTNGHPCGNSASRPVLDSTAIVFVVFGVQGIDKTNVSTHHVLNEDKGTVLYDSEFSATRFQTMVALCKICKAIGLNSDLVTEGGAECFPPSFLTKLRMYGMRLPAECSDLPQRTYIKGQRSHSKVRIVGMDVVWLAMAFESKIYEGKSSFEAYKDYNAWEKALRGVKANLTEEEAVGMETAFQTCDYWEQVFMEIIGVTSAIYGVAFSLLVCAVAVAIFTAHITILLIAFLTIGGVILVVVSMFYLLGWQMGAVEAVSLSILVGSSIDYCIHLVEGFRVAGHHIKLDSSKTSSQIRQQRTIQSVRTIGVSILSSALTTIIAAIPLCFTTVQLFAKFGQIVALNTLVSIIYTLTACSAFLGCFAPARYKWSVPWLLITLTIVGLFFGAGVLALYLMHHNGITIPGPSGQSLFD